MIILLMVQEFMALKIKKFLMKLSKKVLRGAAIWDEVKDRLQ